MERTTHVDDQTPVFGRGDPLVILEDRLYGIDAMLMVAGLRNAR